MDSMVQRLSSRSFSKTEQNEDVKLQGRPKRTDSRKEKTEANRKIQLDDRMKASSKQANRSGERPNVVQKRRSWFPISRGSLSTEPRSSSSSSSMSSDTEAVVAAATALAAAADSASSSPASSLRESPVSSPQARPSWTPLPGIGEESARQTGREDQRPGHSRMLMPSTSMQKEPHSLSAELDRKDSRALVPGSRIPSDSSSHGKGRELAPVSTQLEADENRLDRTDSGRNRRSGSGPSLERRDSSGSMTYEGKREKRDAKAAAWFEDKNTKINDRYRRDRGAVLAWEMEKKEKANLRFQAIERRLEEKRMKALKDTQTEIDIIHRRAERKKAEAEAIRRAELAKVTEMARKIQRTGKMPNQCPCF